MHCYVPYTFIYICELRKPLATLSLDYLLNMQTCDRMCKCACMAACLHALFPIFYVVKEWKVARFDQAIIGPTKPPLEERTVRFRFGADEPPQLIPPV